MHLAILCYIPLPGLCTYSKIKNPSMFAALFPHNLTKAFLELFSSSSFQAIVKFKWHTFAQWHYCEFFFVHLIYFSLFTAITSNTTTNRKLMIASTMILGAFSLFIIHHIITLKKNCVSKRYFLKGTTYFVILVYTLPFITRFLEIIELKLNDYILPNFRCITIFLL